jgi:hypothetical protein
VAELGEADRGRQGRKGTRLTFRDMKLAILTLVQREGALAKADLLGRRLEAHFTRAFTARERGVAQESWSQLLHDGLIATTPAGLPGSEATVGLTSAGAAALETVALDALDLALAGLAPRLVDLRAAAWAAVAC